MFQDLTALNIPEGDVIKIELDGITLWEAVRLPDEYQEVEYVKAEANVKAYIDLGFTFDTKAKIFMSVYVSDITVNTYQFGAAENSGTLRCCLSMPYSQNSTFYGSTGSGFTGVQVTIVTGINELEMAIENKKLMLNNLNSGGNKTTTNQGSYTMTSNLYLFAQNYNGSARFGGVRQIGYFKYYDKNDVLICDLVPCYRKSDGVIGMYDRIRKTFLTNVGSGTFVKGADV